MKDSMKSCAHCGINFPASGRKRFCSLKCQRRDEHLRFRSDQARVDAKNARLRERRSMLTEEQREVEREKKRIRDARRPRGTRPRVGETDTRRNSRLMRKYGLSLEEKNAMADQQGGACLICLEVPTNQYGLVVDHCHDTGKVRGLLCTQCNSAIGLFRDDVQRMSAAIDYVLRHAPSSSGEGGGLGR